MGFETQKPGAVLVTFDDGSAIVKGDGGLEEKQALLQLLQDGGCDEDTAASIARCLLEQGLTLARRAGDTDDPRTMSEATFMAIADQFSPN